MTYYCHLLLLLLIVTFNLIFAQEYILEFTSSIETKSFLSNNKDAITSIRYTYDSDIFTGTAIQFKNEKVAKQLLYHSTVLNYWPIHHRIHQQSPIAFKNQDTSVPFVPQNKDTLRILTQENNKYQSLKSNGKGIKIGVIDSGVDYTLPALGGCFGPGCKIAYGYDLVGDNFDGTLHSIKESHDPMDNCPANSTSATGHGTFVTGIIAAEDKQYNWQGVAPGATIGMWRVYGCNFSGAPNDIVIKAMEMAYQAKMDVISISLGISGGWKEDILSVVADRIVSKGVHVITASGNIGPRGIFLTASPASGKNVITVGSTMNEYVPGYILKLYTKNKKIIDIPYRTFTNTPLVLNEKLPIIPTSDKFDVEHDACHSLNIDLTDAYTLIHEGGCDPLLKIKHAKEVGAKAVIMYTNTKNATTSLEVLNNAVLPIIFINHDDGEIAFKARKAKPTNILIAMEAPETDSNTVSSFSTLGPTNELDLKPELLAVGGNVFSTLPRYLKSYGFRSGTSFSTPYIAGSVALLLSNTKKDIKPDEAKNILMNFAKQVKNPISAIHYGDSPIRQGAGVIDVTRAMAAYEKFGVLPAKLSLNDTSHFQPEQIITIENKQETSQDFYITHIPSLTLTGYSISNTSNFTPTEPIGLYTGMNNSVATIQFSSTHLVIPAGESVQVRVRIQPPQIFELESHVMYGGYIAITSNEERATVPYFGMIGNMKDLPILDRSTNPSPSAPFTFPAIGFSNGTTLNLNDTGHFNIDNTIMNEGVPYILTRLLTGTKLLQFQVLNRRGKVIGDIPIDETRTYMMRNTLTPTEYSNSYYYWIWNVNYVPKDVTLSGSNQDHVPKLLKSGEYRIKIKGLRINGNPVINKDWDEWISPRIKLIIK